MNTPLPSPFFSLIKNNEEKVGVEKALVKFKKAAVKKAISCVFLFSLIWVRASANP
jgi:hypothetical protein